MKLAVFFLLVILLSILEINNMRKKKQIKEIIAFIVLGLITVVFASIYIINPYQVCFTEIVLKALKKI